MARTSQIRSEETEQSRSGGAITSTSEERELVRETVSAPRRTSQVGSAVRIGFGIIWLIDAYFKWQPMFQKQFLDVMNDGAKEEPSWLMPWFHLVHAVFATQPLLFAQASAVIEAAIGIVLILGLARKFTYIVGAIWSLSIWATAEGFGHPNPGMPWTDIGTAIMYTFIFLVLLGLDAKSGATEAGTRPYSVDAVVERRLPAWRRIAEIRR